MGLPERSVARRPLKFLPFKLESNRRIRNRYQHEMKLCWAGFIVVGWVLVMPMGFAQTRAAAEFQLTKITKNLVSTPQFAYTGAQQYQTNQRDRWLEVEVEFTAAPEFTDELTFRYFVLLNGRLLTGEVHHINIAAGG